jgi:hypothetical protein
MWGCTIDLQVWRLGPAKYSYEQCKLADNIFVGDLLDKKAASSLSWITVFHEVGEGNSHKNLSLCSSIIPWKLTWRKEFKLHILLNMHKKLLHTPGVLSYLGIGSLCWIRIFMNPQIWGSDGEEESRVFKTNKSAFQNTANYITDWLIRSCKLISTRWLFFK